MLRKNKIIIIIVGITIILLALLGLTYGYYLTRIQGNTNVNSIEFDTANLSLKYDDGNGMISANNIIPGTEIDSKTFSVENTGDSEIEFSLIFDEVINELYGEEDLQWVLYKLNDLNNYEKVSFGFVRNFLANNYHKQVIYNDGYLEVGEKQEYKILLKYVDNGLDQSEDMNKLLSFRINISEKVYNEKQINAELAYQKYIIEHYGENIIEIEMLENIKETIDDTNVIIKDKNVITGNVATAFSDDENGMQIGDIINFQSPGVYDDYTWYVLGVGEDGNLLITHDVPNYKTALYYKMDDKRSYETAKKVLDSETQIFVDDIVSVSARSITIEDINKIVGYNPYNVGTKSMYSNGIKYKEGTIREYNNIVTYKYTTDGIFASGSNGIIDVSPGTSYLPYNSSEPLKINDENSYYTVRRNYYSYYPETLTDSAYVNGNPIVGISQNDVLYNMLFNIDDYSGNGSDSFGYYIASPYIDAKAGETHWGVRIFDYDRITGLHYWNSNIEKNNKIGSARGYIKAVVSISNDITTCFDYSGIDSTLGVRVFDIIPCED